MLTRLGCGVVFEYRVGDFMWGAVFRQVFAYVLTRRGKRAIAFIGMMALCFVTALLIDTKLYTSAAFTGSLAAILLLMWLLQYWRVRQDARVRQSRREEAMARRHAAAQARGEKLDKAKSAMSGAARTVGKGAASTFGAATSGIASASGRMRFWKREGSA
jgi:hypothetical protein